MVSLDYFSSNRKLIHRIKMNFSYTKWFKLANQPRTIWEAVLLLIKQQVMVVIHQSLSRLTTTASIKKDRNLLLLVSAQEGD